MAQLVLLRSLLLIAGLAAAGWARAGEESAEFRVSVHLNQICVSQTLSELTQAEVKVFCPTGQFVQIEAAQGKPFTGSHGAAHRFHLPASALPPGVLIANADPLLGSGTVASLRIFNLQGDNAPLEVGALRPGVPEATATITNEGGGVVTSLRVYNVAGEDGPVEMLVTF